MTDRRSRSIALSLSGLLLACSAGDDAPSGDTDGTTPSTSGASTSTTPGSESDTTGSTSTTASSTTADPTSSTTSSESDTETGGESDESSTGSGPMGACNPPPLLRLEDIPDDPSLSYEENGDVVAIFEVDGHDLIGKHVIDEAAAEGGLKLWQELTLRIPANQLGDLVQFEISLDQDPVAYFNRNGNVTTDRTGLKLGFSVENFSLNDPDPCAPLRPARGNFDWSLVHEFGHLRGFLDRSWFSFLATFPDIRGEGDGYPDDGTPLLTGDFVTSYAERADGDEDHAESWTTYVMLADDELPPESEDEPLSLKKIRWMDAQPGLRELRQALRVTEADAEDVTVDPAPALDPAWLEEGNAPILAPVLFQGTWRENPTDGYALEFTADDVVVSQYESGTEVSRVSMAEQRGAGTLDYYQYHNTSPSFAYSYIVSDEPGIRHNHDFFFESDDGPLEDGTMLFARETFDANTGELEFLPDLILTKVD